MRGACRTMIRKIYSHGIADAQHFFRRRSAGGLMKACRLNHYVAQTLLCQLGCQRTAADISITKKNNLARRSRGGKALQQCAMLPHKLLLCKSAFQLAKD